MHQATIVNSPTKFYTKVKCRATNKEKQDKELLPFV